MQARDGWCGEQRKGFRRYRVNRAWVDDVIANLRAAGCARRRVVEGSLVPNAVLIEGAIVCEVALLHRGRGHGGQAG